MINRYNNYHKHDMYSNIKSLDCVVKPIEYIERAKELDGDKAIFFSTNHGYQGNMHEYYTLCKEHNVKLIAGVEAYYVPDRFEKDKSNYHIVIIAKNNNGYKAINKLMSEANVTGYYYKPRIDDELLFNLNPNDVIVTTACVASRLREENGAEEWIIKMKEHFGDNFYLEVQNHNEQVQKDYNKRILSYANKYGIEIIHANDSHYIKPEDAKYRDLFLKAKGIVYEDESNFVLDYPSYDEIVERYKIQGILNDKQIHKALENTLIFDNFEGIEINDDIKLPSISNDANKELREILNKELSKINKEEYQMYKDAVDYELDIIERTHMEDYFILDYHIVKKGREDYNGLLTKTGRGSAPSFIINKFLGLTEIDRLKAPVPLFPTRFMSVERILGARSLPDIDLNTEDAQPFIQATKDLLGEENCAWMISYKPLQKASAFRLYCKSIDMKVSEYDEVAKDLEKYEDDKEWKDIIEESNHFVGVVESISPSPCSMVLHNKDISEEIGLVRTKDGVCCILDGYNCDKYKYLKNDYLTVKIWHLIRKTCEFAQIPIPSIEELNDLLDDKTFDIYKNELTCTINQADSTFATGLIKDYKPKNIAEMSAFVAAIRPGFASLLDDFIQRKDYSTGVKELDDLLEDSYHRLMYQESIMKYLIWLGIPESQSYDIIKKIAKKKFKEKELKELKDELHTNWTKVVGREEGFNETWQVVEDASRYSFNASHSLSYAYDSLYSAYLKSHYPLEYYCVALNNYQGDEERTTKLTNELEYFNIKIKQPQFRYSRSEYYMDKQTNSIYKGINSIKFLNQQVADYLYSLRDKQYDTFTDLLIDLDKHINSKQLTILIKLDFFNEFGKSAKLLKTYENFSNLYGKKQIKKDKYPELNDTFKQFATKETASLFKFDDIEVNIQMLKALESNLINEDLDVAERIKAEFEFTGSCNLIDKRNPRHCYVIDVNLKYTPTLKLYCLGSGNTQDVKVTKKIWNQNKLEVGDIIYLDELTKKPKRKKIGDEWITTDEFNLYAESYWKV